ncbi:hypothetical protein VUR80DRAFT_9004 [Thermomyces stellatus]
MEVTPPSPTQRRPMGQQPYSSGAGGNIALHGPSPGGGRLPCKLEGCRLARFTPLPSELPNTTSELHVSFRHHAWTRPRSLVNPSRQRITDFWRETAADLRKGGARTANPDREISNQLRGEWVAGEAPTPHFILGRSIAPFFRFVERRLWPGSR